MNRTVVGPARWKQSATVVASVLSLLFAESGAGGAARAGEVPVEAVKELRAAVEHSDSATLPPAPRDSWRRDDGIASIRGDVLPSSLARPPGGTPAGGAYVNADLPEGARLRTEPRAGVLPPLVAPHWPRSLPCERPAQPYIADHFCTETFLDSFLFRLQHGGFSFFGRREVERYLEERATRLQELQATLRSLPSDAAARKETLQQFALRQQPALGQLEARGEALRKSFKLGSVGGFFSEGARADVLAERRKAPPSDTDFLYRSDAETAVLVLSIAYQDGLSDAQRWLLREMTARPSAEEPSAPSDPQEVVFFFDPATTRVVLPAAAPEALRRRIGEYVAKRQELKAELRAELLRLNAAKTDERDQALIALAARQAPLFAEQERAADEIRAGLVRLPEFSVAPSDPGVPAVLAERIRAHRRKKRELQMEFARAVAAVSDAPGTEAGRTMLRVYWTDAPGQMARQREILAAFEGLHAAELDEVERRGVKAGALDRELRGQLRIALEAAAACASPEGPRVRAALAAQTAERERADVWTAIRAALARRGEEVRRLEQEAADLRAALRAESAPAVPALLANWQAHLGRLEAFGRALQAEIAAATTEQLRAQEHDRRRAAVFAIEEQNREALAELEAEEAAIRRELAKLAVKFEAPGGGAGTTLDGLARQLRRSESWFATTNYRTAVLEPGLSPAQRRLLLGAALLEMRRWNVPTEEVAPARR